jgi:hypothetical protein
MPSFDDVAGAAWDLFNVFVSIAPMIIALGSDNLEAEGQAKRLPALMAVDLFCRVIELTLEKWGAHALLWKLGEAAGKNSTLPEFLLPSLRERVAAFESAVASTAPKSNRKERRRANSRSTRR